MNKPPSKPPTIFGTDETRMFVLGFVEGMLEATPYPDPPEYVKSRDDYLIGCTAYRNALVHMVKTRVKRFNEEG